MKPNCRQPAWARAEGFTLIEVVLALSIMMVISLAVMAFYQQAGQIRQETLEKVETLTAARLFMDRLTGELRAATRSRYLQMGLEGGGDHISFLTTVLPGPGAWIEPDPRSANSSPMTDQRMVDYRVRYSGDEPPAPVGLDRYEQRLLTAVQVNDKPVKIMQELTDRIRFVNFRFWDGAAWQEAWSGTDLPTGVEVTLGAEPLPQGTERSAYPYPTFRRVIYVPAGHWWGGVQAAGLEEGAS